MVDIGRTGGKVGGRWRKDRGEGSGKWKKG